MKLYIYNPETFEVIDTIEEESSEGCEEKAADRHERNPENDFFLMAYLVMMKAAAAAIDE